MDYENVALQVLASDILQHDCQEVPLIGESQVQMLRAVA
jgi:hypothetical protein